MTRRRLILSAASLIGARAYPADTLKEDRFVGSIAADWKLMALNGKSYRLSDFRGKAVVLNFWATWCAPCRVETKWLVELYKDIQARNVEILGISMDGPSEDEEVARFAATYAVTYPILLRGSSIADAYGGVRYLPQTFFVDRDGKVVRNTHGIKSRDALEAEVRRLVQ